MVETEKRSETIECFSDSGKIVAQVEIEISGRKGNEKKNTSPLVKVSKETAKEFGESEIQLREHSRYRYRVKSKLAGLKLALRESHEVSQILIPNRGQLNPLTIVDPLA